MFYHFRCILIISLFCTAAFGQTSQTYCNGITTLTADTGKFSDGSGLNNYGDNSNCSWLISPSVSSNFITLTFTSFDTELNNDIVRVYNGSTVSAPLLGTFSGSNLPPILTATGSYMLVTFISNSTIDGQGWTANYNSFTSNYCSAFAAITAPSGVVSDGSGSANYLNNTNCTWLINPPGAASIAVNFTQFIIESNYDFVLIYNGTTTGSPLIGTYTGNTIPPSFTNNGPILIRFYSDGSVNFDGWSLNYTSSSTPVYCSGITSLAATSGIISDGSGANNYGDYSNCSWLINPSVASNFITLTFTSFDTELNNDIVSIFNGSSVSAPLLGTFSGSNLPPVLTATGSYMLVTFTSNSTINGQGWSANYNSFTSIYCAAISAITAPSGIVSDGSGTANYLNNTNCSWIINPPGATSIALTFNQFYTESCCDYVRIYNGTTTSAPLLGTFSGNSIPATISSNGPMLIIFTSDNSINFDGWSASYVSSTTPLYCSGNTTLTASAGTISDGSGINNYGDNSNCSWLISPSAASNYITLTFTSFATELNNDIVRVYNGSSITAPLLGTFSGTNLPPIITATGSYMLVTFTTNNTIDGQGWTANYNSFTSNYCSTYSTITAANGILSDGSGLSNYLNNTNCTWLINPPGATSVILTFSQFSTESCCDYVRIYDGATTSAPLLGSFSGSSIPASIMSHNGPMLIVFTSDNSVTYDGWTASYTSGNTSIGGASFSLNTNSINFGTIGGFQTITVTSNAVWSVSSVANWISFNPTIGIGNSLVTISTSSNLSHYDRNGYLAFTVGTTEYILIVNQLSPFFTSLSTNETTANVRIFPNPTGSDLNLNLESDFNGSVVVSLKDLMGNKVLQSTLSKNEHNLQVTFDLANLSSGLYIMTIGYNGITFNRKITKL